MYLMVGQNTSRQSYKSDAAKFFRLIVRKSLKSELVEIIHQSHEGVVSCEKKSQD